MVSLSNSVISNKKDMQVRFKIRNRNNTMMIVR